MIKDRLNSWHGMPTSKFWVCPNCECASHVESWMNGWMDGTTEDEMRECPRCHTRYDHQLDIELLISAQNPGRPLVFR